MTRNMSSINHLSRGSKTLLKVILLIAMGLMVVSLTNYTVRQLARRDESSSETSSSSMDEEGGDTNDESDDDTGDTDDDDDVVTLPIGALNFNRGADSDFNNPCIPHRLRGRDRLFCVPSCYIVGLDSVGDNFLYQAIDMHTDIMTYIGGSSYLEGLNSMAGFLKREFVRQYNAYSTTIKEASNSQDLILCDKGKLLARHYECGVGHVITHNEIALRQIKKVYQQSNIAIVVRNPADRVYAEFCANGGSPTAFSALVQPAINRYETCLANRAPVMCIYDKVVQDETVINLGAGRYCDLWPHVLSNFPSNQVLWVPWSKLSDPNQINSVMAEVFMFLGVSSSPIDFRVMLTGGNICNGVPMDSQVRVLLENFYAPCNDVMYQDTENPIFKFGLI